MTSPVEVVLEAVPVEAGVEVEAPVETVVEPLEESVVKLLLVNPLQLKHLLLSSSKGLGVLTAVAMSISGYSYCMMDLGG